MFTSTRRNSKRTYWSKQGSKWKGLFLPNRLWSWLNSARSQEYIFCSIAIVSTILIWYTVTVDGSVKSEWFFCSHSKIYWLCIVCETSYCLTILKITDLKNHCIDTKYWDGETAFPGGIWKSSFVFAVIYIGLYRPHISFSSENDDIKIIISDSLLRFVPNSSCVVGTENRF